MKVSVHEAKAKLSSLLQRVSEGEEVVITRNGEPVARLVPIVAGNGRRKLGGLSGRIRVRHDFDAPLPDSVLDAFEGKS